MSKKTKSTATANPTTPSEQPNSIDAELNDIFDRIDSKIAVIRNHARTVAQWVAEKLLGEIRNRTSCKCDENREEIHIPIKQLNITAAWGINLPDDERIIVNLCPEERRAELIISDLCYMTQMWGEKYRIRVGYDTENGIFQVILFP